MNKLFIGLFFLSFNVFAANSSFWRTHSLVMIYSSTCPHCHNQSQVLAPLVLTEQIALKLYSIDNQPLPEFKQFSPVPNGLLEAAFPDQKVSYPALFIVTNQSLKLYPLSYGFLDSYALSNRIDVLKDKITQYEGHTNAY